MAGLRAWGAFRHCARSKHFTAILTPHPALSPLRGEGIAAVSMLTTYRSRAAPAAVSECARSIVRLAALIEGRYNPSNLVSISWENAEHVCFHFQNHRSRPESHPHRRANRSGHAYSPGGQHGLARVAGCERFAVRFRSGDGVGLECLRSDCERHCFPRATAAVVDATRICSAALRQRFDGIRFRVSHRFGAPTIIGCVCGAVFPGSVPRCPHEDSLRHCLARRRRRPGTGFRRDKAAATGTTGASPTWGTTAGIIGSGRRET